MAKFTSEAKVKADWEYDGYIVYCKQIGMKTKLKDMSPIENRIHVQRAA